MPIEGAWLGLGLRSPASGRRNRAGLLLAAAAGLLSSAAASGQGAAIAPRTLTPPLADGPTVVLVDLYGVEVLGINEQEETFEIEADLAASWVDERLAFDEAATGASRLIFQGEAVEEALKSEVWWPDFEITDSRGSRDRMHVQLAIDSDGWVHYHERFSALIKQSLDLASFPFDESEISLTVTPFSYDAEEVVFLPAEEARQPLSWEPSEWVVSDPSLVVAAGRFCADSADPCAENADCPGEGEECVAGFASARVKMSIARVSDHYVWKIILPLALIVLVSTAIFWIDLERFGGDRLAVAFTGVLTVVAFDFVSSGSLPKLWYTTTLDKILITAYFFMACIVAENVLVAVLTRHAPAAARWVDRAARLLVPLAFLVVLLGLAVFA